MNTPLQRSTTAILLFIILAILPAIPTVNTEAWTAPTPLTIDTGKDRNPSITQASDGTIWIVWASNRTGNYEIYYKTWNGTDWSNATQLTNHTSSDDAPSITQAADGTIWVVWNSYRTGNYEIYYKTWNGTDWSNATQLTTDLETDLNPSITQAADGTIWVVWESYRISYWDEDAQKWLPQSEIFYNTWNGTNWSGDTRLTYDDREDKMPSITQLANGTILVVWSSDRWETIAENYDISYNTWNGTNWSGDTRLTTDTNDDWMSSVTQTIDGKIWVVWHSMRAFNVDIYYRTYDGVTWSSDTRLTNHTASDLQPSIIQASDGTIWIVWASNRTGNYDIFYVVHNVAITAPPLTTVPTIDGNWTAGEWDDANEYTITGSGGTSYIRIKRDSSYLYILVDSPWDTTPTQYGWVENTWIAFDTAHNHGSAPQTDDYLFNSEYTVWNVAFQGNGTGWEWMSVPTGYLANQSYASGNRVDEIRIPLSNVGSPGATVGFYVLVIDDGSDPDGWGGQPPTAWVEWPPAAGGDAGGWPLEGTDPCPAPSVWGHLKLTGLSHPVAAFSFSPFAPNAGDVVTFNALGSYDPDGTIANYTWNFDDGNVTTANITTITHVFSTDGNYNVNLTVTDNDGLTDCIIHTITVGAPVAAFTFSPPNPDPGDVVTFNASASYDPDGAIVNYTWNFGDGNITTVSIPIIVHTFSGNRSYNVNLTVTDNDGLKDWVLRTVTVGIPPKITTLLLTTSPTIDGNWTAGEWDDANEYEITSSGGTSYLRIKHDSTYLYILIDSPWDITPPYVWPFENTWVAFDTNHTHGASPDAGEYLFNSEYTVYNVAWQGTGAGWTTMSPPAGYTAVQALSPSPNNATPHRIDEIKIPLAYVGAIGQISGFYVMVYDQNTTNYVEWPPAAGGNPDGWPPMSDPCPAPDAWSDLTLVAPAVGGIVTPVDKLALLAPYIVLAITMVAAIVGVIYARKRWFGKAATIKP